MYYTLLLASVGTSPTRRTFCGKCNMFYTLNLAFHPCIFRYVRVLNHSSTSHSHDHMWQHDFATLLLISFSADPKSIKVDRLAEGLNPRSVPFQFTCPWLPDLANRRIITSTELQRGLAIAFLQGPSGIGKVLKPQGVI